MGPLLNYSSFCPSFFFLWRAGRGAGGPWGCFDFVLAPPPRSMPPRTTQSVAPPRAGGRGVPAAKQQGPPMFCVVLPRAPTTPNPAPRPKPPRSCSPAWQGLRSGNKQFPCFGYLRVIDGYKLCYSNMRPQWVQGPRNTQSTWPRSTSWPVGATEYFVHWTRPWWARKKAAGCRKRPLTSCI